MKIYVVGSSKDKFFKLDESREKFLIDKQHEGDNIDNVNPWYCEMTGLYYLWKHVDDEIVGLEHYRRYMTNSNKPITEAEAKVLLEDYDLLCPIAQYSKTKPVKTYITLTKKWDDFNYFLQFVKRYVSEDYYQACIFTLDSSYHLLGNMFIARKKFCDDYCDFIFDVLDNFMKFCKFTHHNLSKRICGYLTEFLFKAYCLCYNKKYKIINFKFIK